ncbi:unnamed protein product [Lymnaea stagnalis]|uniref:RING-type domain-containing protein n=1 Tax=Lymnaea stagnalis TaxID=6523 RepID=A0AAV2HTR5_LYMST
MASRIRRRSESQLSPEEESLLQTIISQDGESLWSLMQRHRLALVAVLQMEDGYHERFVLYVAGQLERDGKSVTSANLYAEVERRAALFTDSFMKKLNAQTFSKTFSDLTERKTPAPQVNSSATSFRSASRLPVADIATPGSATGESAATATPGQNQRNSVTQPLNSPQYILTESNRIREGASSLVTADCAAGGATAVKGTPSPTDRVKRNNPQRENSSLSSGCGVDAVDGAVLYEDEVDNAAPKRGFTTSRPQPPKTGADVTYNTGTFVRDSSMAKPRESEELQDERKKTEHIRECLYAVTGENKILESYRLCTVCRKSPRNITFLPCGHFTTCRECAGPIYVCGLCSKNVLATVDTFLS